MSESHARDANEHADHECQNIHYSKAFRLSSQPLDISRQLVAFL